MAIHEPMTKDEFVRFMLQNLVPRMPSTYEMARRLDVHPNTISSWKKGTHLPSIYHLYLIKKVLGIPVEELFD